MDIKKMMLIDKYVGHIFCLILTIHNNLSVFFLQKKKETNKGPKNILLIKFWGMGTIIVASASLKALKTAFPDANVLFLTLSQNRDLPKLLGVSDKIITIDVERGLIKFTLSFLSALYYIRKQNIDIALDLEFFTRISSIVTYLSGATTKVGFCSWEIWRGNFHNIKVPFNRYWHMSKNFENLVTHCGIDKNSIKPVLIDIPDKEKQSTKMLLQENGFKENERIICVNINAAVEFGWERRWPAKNFLSLIHLLNEHYKDLKFILIGSKKEFKYVDDFCKGINKDTQVYNFAGKTSIFNLAGLLQCCKMLITNDSGPLHLAVLLNVPTVSFFGSDTPVLYGPKGEKHIVFYKNIDCSPCVNVLITKQIKCYKKSNECMEKISVEEVFEAIKKSGIL